MRAVVFDGGLKFADDFPKPSRPPGWALIRVRKAGICGTDLEIIKGYKGFNGVLGHEFAGLVEECDDPGLTGRRVVGEINVFCGKCESCRENIGRHCPNRRVLGILGLNGCMADYCVLPASNLHEVPESITDQQAVMVEPLSAACEILEQTSLRGMERAVVLGDGRLGILCAWVLATRLADVTLIGHHPEKLEIAGWRHLKTAPDICRVATGADIVVEATGSESGLGEAISLCRPRGTIVLKSTTASSMEIDLSPIVVNEITVIGSRCGRFGEGLRMIRSHPDMRIEELIAATYPADAAVDAFDQAGRAGVLKVVLDMG